jgi:hypothetical protein
MFSRYPIRFPSQYEAFTNFRAFETFSQSSQNAVHKLPCTCRRYNFSSRSGYRELFVGDADIKNVWSETLASVVRISRNRRRARWHVSILPKTPSTWQVAIQEHILMPKTRYSTQLDVNQTNFLSAKRSSLDLYRLSFRHFLCQYR